MILTLAELRTHIDTALADAALQRLADAAEEAIVARAGAPGDRTELFTGGGYLIALARPASLTGSGDAITITETIGTTVTTLDVDDYYVRPGGYLIERVNNGTNPRRRWHGRVLVTYSPVDDTATRIGVQIDLCQLAIDYNPGLTSERIGEWEETFGAGSAWNNSLERDAILDRLDSSRGLVVV